VQPVAGMIDSGPFIERIQMLEEEIRELRAVISPPGLSDGFLAIGFTRMQSAILAALLGRGTLSRQQLMAVMYPDVDDRYDRPLKLVDAHLSLLRRRMKPFGLTVDCTWGVGYHLTAESKAGLRVLLTRPARQAAE
jgi:hypothetical protein